MPAWPARCGSTRPSGWTGWTWCRSAGHRPTSGPGGRGGRHPASAFGSGARRSTAAGRSRPSRRFAGWTWPGRCCNCSPSGRHTRIRFRGSTRRRPRLSPRRWPCCAGSTPLARMGQSRSWAARWRALFAAFPDRLARRRNPGGAKGVMVGGRGVRLAPTSGVTESELFVCVDVDAGQAETLVRQASAVARDWLPPERIVTAVDVAFDADAERVTVRKRVRFDDLILEDVPANPTDEAEMTRVLAEAAAARLERVRPPDDSPAGRYRTRIRCLRAWMPELGLPAFDDDELREVLTWLCPGRRSFEELRRADWLAAFQARLTHAQRQAVEREAPERLEVPSGSALTLAYEEGRPPVLAVRVQELFGLRDTPRLAGGRVRVLLHLLAPNYRPQQVTDDLASFWANTYPQVRKELRARYPKHAWPDDPLDAVPKRK